MKNELIEIIECLQWATTFAEGSRDLDERLNKSFQATPLPTMDYTWTPKFNEWIDRCRAAITLADWVLLASPSVTLAWQRSGMATLYLPKHELTALATIWVLKAYDTPTDYPDNPSAETYTLREEDLPVGGFTGQGYLCEVAETIEVAEDSDEYSAAVRNTLSALRNAEEVDSISGKTRKQLHREAEVNRE